MNLGTKKAPLELLRGFEDTPCVTCEHASMLRGLECQDHVFSREKDDVNNRKVLLCICIEFIINCLCMFMLSYHDSMRF